MNAVLCFSESGFFKKNSHPIKFKTIHVMFPPSPNSMLYSELCVWRPSKKQPFLFIVFGTSKHNIEVGGYGGNVCIYGVSCGWLFFLKNPGRVFFVSSLFQHTHTDSCPSICPRGQWTELTLCVYALKTYWTQQKFKLIPDSEKHRTAFTPLFASQLPVLFVRADMD